MQSGVLDGRAALQAAESTLQAAGIETARLDAEVLLAATLGHDRSRLIAHLADPLTADRRESFGEMVRRRAKREPLAYITGMKEFWSLGFRVTPDVLIPRPETELLVEIICRLVGRSKAASPRIWDIGTGSGCIAVALAHELPDTKLLASDRSEKALAVARQNAAVHGVEHRLSFLLGDLLEPVVAEPMFDVIVSNPPYVGDADRLAPELDWEPITALRGGPQGLDLLRRIISAAPAHLCTKGWLVVEIGAGQEKAVLELADGTGLTDISIETDLAGLPRALVAKRE